MTLNDLGRRMVEYMFHERMTMSDLRRAADAIDVPIPPGCKPPPPSTDDRLDALANDIAELRAGIDEILVGVRAMREVPGAHFGPMRYATGARAQSWMR